MDVAGKMGTASARPALDLAWTHRSLRRLWQSPIFRCERGDASRLCKPSARDTKLPGIHRTIFIEHAGILWFRQILTACWRARLLSLFGR